jgi:hypothetical protein
MEADVLTFELVGWQPADRRRDLSDRGAEPGEPQCELGRVARPAQIEVQRLLREPRPQGVGNRRRSLGEVPASGSHASSPPVTTTSRWSVPLVSHQCATSRLTQIDAADSGQARRMK